MSIRPRDHLMLVKDPAKGKTKTVTPPTPTATVKHPGGRPSKATPSVIELLVEALRDGATHALACAYAGIAESTFYRHMQDNQEFREAIGSAEALGALENLQVVKALTHSVDQTVALRAATWILERRYPEQYGKQIVANQHSGEQTLHIVMDAAWRGEEQVADQPVIEAAVNVAATDPAEPVETTVTFEGDS
jgi:hypothetical protein